eukprot:SAG22_NODE_3992_length_1434_cov_1.704120_2_plen_85_part_00
MLSIKIADELAHLNITVHIIIHQIQIRTKVRMVVAYSTTSKNLDLLCTGDGTGTKFSTVERMRTDFRVPLDAVLHLYSLPTMSD